MAPKLNTVMSRPRWLVDPLRSELVRINTETSLALVRRVDRCGDDWHGRFQCQRMACQRCRWCYVQAQKRAALRQFADSSPDDMAMLTVVIGAVPGTDDIGPTWKGFGKALRNVIEVQRRHSDAWRTVQAMTWLEVDAVLGADVPRLKPIKAAQFAEIGPPSYRLNDPVWWVTCHGLIDAGAAGLDRVERTLKDHWSGTRQLHLVRLHRNRAKEANIQQITSYALKHRHKTELTDQTTAWPVQWVAEYHNWLGSWSRGFQSVRHSIKPSNICENIEELDDPIDVDPMPFTHSVSTFTMTY